MAEPFRERLRRAIEVHGPLCPGIDPSPVMLERWGLDDSATGAREFALRYLDALAGRVAVMKPNVAFFEQYGAAGIGALEAFVFAARDAGVLSILDAKRGDIESTNIAYARAWVGDDSPLAGDAVTLSPFLGARALAPFVEEAASSGRGVFVVARSSNPEGREVQLATTAAGASLEASLLEEVARRPSVVGAVVGLMAGAPPLPLPKDAFYLAPGLGSQGAGLADLAGQFGGLTSTPVVVNLSRSLAVAGPDRAALADAAARAQGEIAGVLRPSSG